MAWAYLWARSFRLKNLRRLVPWFLIVGTFGFVRWSKGAVFADFYALVSRPFWPGPAQRDWVQSGVQLETQTKLRLLEQDNERLRGLLSLKNGSGINRISAAVIARSTQGWWQKLELSKGAQHGINPGNAVIGPGGLLGAVHSVTPTTARVKLLTAPGSRVGVWISRSKRHGMLIGMGTSRPELVFLDTDPEVLPGDVVSISPASTLFPPNLPVGVIQSVDDRVWPTPNAIVQLIASPEAIDWVQIQIR